MNSGSPNCQRCNGRGLWRSPSGWRVCVCVRPGQAETDAVRKAAEIATGRKRLTMAEMLRQGRSNA